MTKNDLRATYKAKRDALSQNDIAEKSLAIANGLLPLPIWDKMYFHVFLPIVEMHEVDTECILHLLAGKDKEIVVSKSDFETRKMTHFLLTDNTKIKKNDYNIPEPVNGLGVPANVIEVVFVPLLAFDVSGNRVGYGKGFYDKFLSQCKPETIKIGLSFFDAVDVVHDVFESDVKLDYCVTPEKTYKF
ncbi:MAG TPA: 5-formyltetrahydrofolate cyclo-ligase [Flavobacterium sp.]|nr:5-formyltetrahydrofolate cyclo-ligase [Flavobacterium sp.]